MINVYLTLIKLVLNANFFVSIFLHIYEQEQQDRLRLDDIVQHANLYLAFLNLYEQLNNEV